MAATILQYNILYVNNYKVCVLSLRFNEAMESLTLPRNITLLWCTHMYRPTCNKADDHTQVHVINCNNYRVIDITRLWQMKSVKMIIVVR